MKENIRNNKKRLIIYGILAIITITFSISGAILFNTGHGTVGSVRVKLIPIAFAFNDLDAVIRNGYVKAECNGKEIVVTYKNPDAHIDERFVYEFKTQDNIDYITNTYSDANSETGDFVATNMVEAIYKVNAGTGKVSDTYRLSSFGATSLRDGVVYTDKEEIVTVELNIKTNIVKNALALNIETIQDSDYIHVEELAELTSSLQKNRTFRIEKRDTTMYVKEEDIYYEIFFSFKDREIMLRSAASAIKILKPDLYTKLYNGTNKLDFNITLSEYKIIENVSFSEQGIFKSNENIFEVFMFK